MKARTAARRGRLSKERILRAALQVADAEGLDALSLRRIAAQLGVSAMSLYRHYRNKAEIEDGIVDHVVGSYRVTDHDESDWVDWVYVTCAQMRSVLCAHPGLLALLDKASMNASSHGINALGVMEAVLSRLRNAGLAPTPTARLYRALMAVTIGSVVRMSRPARRAVSCAGEHAGEGQRVLDRSYAGVPVRQFPQVAAMAPELAKAWDAAEFEAIVRQIINAFAPRTRRSVAGRGRATVRARRAVSATAVSGHKATRRS